MMAPFREVVGFDLGHGETAVAWVRLESQSAPQILEVNGRRSQVTAVGRHPTLGVVVGERALRFPDMHDTRIAFKQRPPGDADYAATLRAFVSQYHSLLHTAGTVGPEEETCYFVGCPSGWSAGEMEVYRQMLEDAGLPHVRVVRESRAALLQAREAGRITEAEVRDSVLVIDVGSSTVDVSHVCGGLHDEKLDTGCELGASLIDREIYARTIARHPRASALAAFLADPANGVSRNRCELACRKAKEDFWKDEQEYRHGGHAPYADVGLGNGFENFETHVTAAEIDAVLATPLAALGGQTWAEAFRELLRGVDAELKARDAELAAVVLTGGAARMSFVETMCRERFPGARLVRHPAPEEAVARGLARWGQIFLNTSAFSDEVARLCNERVEPLVQSRKDRLVETLAREVGDGIVNEVAVDAVRSWRNGEVDTLDELTETIASNAERWLKGEHGQLRVERACEEFVRGLTVEVDGWTLELCRRYGIPAASLRLDAAGLMRGGVPGVAVPTRIDSMLSATGTVAFVGMIVATAIMKPYSMGLAVAFPGWALLAGIIFVGLLLVLPQADEKLKHAKVPLAFRRRVLPDEQRAAEKMRPGMHAEIVKTLAAEERFTLVTRAIADQISAQLNAKANEVKWIIS
jgi:molecular chaperone DnaK (HSP70)